jgi:hypothetical protein
MNTEVAAVLAPKRKAAMAEPGERSEVSVGIDSHTSPLPKNICSLVDADLPTKNDHGNRRAIDSETPALARDLDRSADRS